MQNPAIQRAMTNPRVIQAISQIQSGIQQLQQEAPEMLPILGVAPSPSLSSFTAPSTGSTSSTTTTTTAQSSTNASSQGATSTTPSATAGQGGTNPMFNQFLQSMLQQQLGQNLSQQQPPEERFRAQLEQLAAMGFVDRAANLRGSESSCYFYRRNFIDTIKLST